jgi:hypothetical protein
MGSQRKVPMHRRPSKGPRPAPKTKARKWRNWAAVVALALLPVIAAWLLSYVPHPEHHFAVPPRFPPTTPQPSTSPTPTHFPTGPGGPQVSGSPSPQPVTNPLEMQSEDPLDPAVEWAYFKRLMFDAQQQAQLTFEIDGGQVAALNQYFFGRGGYAPTVHTRLVLANYGPASIEIDTIEVLSTCRGPAKSTLVDITGLTDSPSSASPSDIMLGYRLNQRSQEAQASTAPSADPATWSSDYFASHSTMIGPYGTQAFDIWVIPSDAACSFWYQVTISDDGAKFVTAIGDGDQPFRVSAVPVRGARAGPTSTVPSGYGNVYVGGTASRLPHGALYRELPRHGPVTALHRAA